MTVSVTVSEVVDETTSVKTLRLVRTDGLPFDGYVAGAHVDVVGPTGILRQYSLCSPPQDPSSILIAVKKEPQSRGGSEALHTVSVGDELTVGVPRNLLTLAADADKHVLIAGGIGVTPLLSMAYELSHAGGNFELHYFARSREEAAFVDMLQDVDQFAGKLYLHFGIPRSEITATFEKLAASVTSGTHVYTCGPVGFMDEVTRVFGSAVGEEQVHTEHFVAAELDTSSDSGFTVELDTGEEFEIPADKSILDVLEDNGIEVFKSCEEGICGSCISGVLAGVPEHRDQCLSAADKAAGGQIALCVSRAKSERLVIELY